MFCVSGVGYPLPKRQTIRICDSLVPRRSFPVLINCVGRKEATQLIKTGKRAPGNEARFVMATKTC